jgi:serine/threonine-protein kinase
VDDTTLLFRGVTLGTRRTVAIRILRFGLSESTEDIERFLAETRILSRLDHSCVVKVLSAGDLEGIPYFVQEFVPGPCLKTYVQENGPLTEERALEILSQVAEGLRHAHTLDVLHGSLKPGSILIPRLGPAKVTDFALRDWSSFAAARGAERVEAPHYISPEQAQMAARPTVRSDVYTLGATLFYTLTGRPPFRGGHLEVVRQHLKRPTPDPRVLVPQLTPGCANLVLHLMEKKPENRPSSMEEVLTAIDRVRSDAELGETAPSPPSEPSRLRSRRRGSSPPD